MSKWQNIYSAAVGAPVTGLLGWLQESQMSRRKRKGKVQSSDQLGDLTNMPQYIQDMAMAGRDEDGNISSKSAARGAGFTNKEIATEAANYAKMQESREYEQSVWEERESLQGQVKQAQEAGINPAMLAGGFQSGSGSPVTSGDTSVTSQSSYDEFGGGLSLLQQLLGMFSSAGSMANDIRRTNIEDVNSITSRMNETRKTDAVVDNTNADTELKRSQTAAQDLSNSNFWRKADDDHSMAVADAALKVAHAGKIEFDKSMAEKMYKLQEDSVNIQRFVAENGRMLILAQIQKLYSDINAQDFANKSTVMDIELKGKQSDLMVKQLDELNERIDAMSRENLREDFARSYGVPSEYGYFVNAVESKMESKAFNIWLQAFQQALADKATAHNVVRETGIKLFGLQFGTSNTYTRGMLGSPQF